MNLYFSPTFFKNINNISICFLSILTAPVSTKNSNNEKKMHSSLKCQIFLTLFPNIISIFSSCQPHTRFQQYAVLPPTGCYHTLQIFPSLFWNPKAALKCKPQASGVQSFSDEMLQVLAKSSSTITLNLTKLKIYA